MTCGTNSKGAALREGQRDRRHGSAALPVVLLFAMFLSGCKTSSHLNQSSFSRFIGLDDFSNFARSQDAQGDAVLLSPEITSSIDFNQLVVSWNADASPGTFLTVEARAILQDHQTKFGQRGHVNLLKFAR